MNMLLKCLSAGKLGVYAIIGILVIPSMLILDALVGMWQNFFGKKQLDQGESD